jgi:PAS domain S-box-containing protein
VDDEGRIQLANARASLMFGYTNEELLDLPLDTLIPDWVASTGTAKEPPTPAARAGPRTPRHHARIAGARRDGGSVPVELSLSRVEGGLVLASVSDITERLRSEHESAQQRNELAHCARVADGRRDVVLARARAQPAADRDRQQQPGGAAFPRRRPGHEQELRETLADIAASGTRAGEVIRRLRAMLMKEEPSRSRWTSTS